MARLVVRQAPDLRPDRGRDLGRQFNLNGATVLIGRARDATLSLNSANVSKRHAEVSWRNGAYFIHDLASTQGTKLNGLPVSLNPQLPTKLKSGDRIALADTVLEFIDEIPGDFEAKTLPGAVNPPLKFQPPAVVPISSGKASDAVFPVPPMSVLNAPAASNVPGVIAPVKRMAPVTDGKATGASGRTAPVNTSAAKMTLPVCLILDGSGSMAGEPIAAAKAGLAEFLKIIKLNPALRDTVDVSVLFFGSTVKFLPGPFSQGSASERELAAFKPSGLCALGAAIDEALRVFAGVADRRRPPLFFVGIDGVATDAWDDAVHALVNQNFGRLIACEWGEFGDASPLAAGAQKTIAVKRFDKASSEALMRWLADVVKAMLSEAVDGPTFKWPPLPEGGAVAFKA